MPQGPDYTAEEIAKAKETLRSGAVGWPGTPFFAALFPAFFARFNGVFACVLPVLAPVSPLIRTSTSPRTADESPP